MIIPEPELIPLSEEIVKYLDDYGFTWWFKYNQISDDIIKLIYQRQTLPNFKNTSETMYLSLLNKEQEKIVKYLKIISIF